MQSHLRQRNGNGDTWLGSRLFPVNRSLLEQRLVSSDGQATFHCSNLGLTLTKHDVFVLSETDPSILVCVRFLNQFINVVAVLAAT
jgi:hypothetical protein